MQGAKGEKQAIVLYSWKNYGPQQWQAEQDVSDGAIAALSPQGVTNTVSSDLRSTQQEEILVWS